MKRLQADVKSWLEEVPSLKDNLKQIQAAVAGEQGPLHKTQQAAEQAVSDLQAVAGQLSSVQQMLEGQAGADGWLRTLLTETRQSTVELSQLQQSTQELLDQMQSKLEATVRGEAAKNREAIREEAAKNREAIIAVVDSKFNQLREEKKEDDSKPLGGADWEMWTKNDKLFPPNLPEPIVDALELSACNDPALFVAPKWILERAREALQARGVRTLLLLGLPGQGKTHALCSLAKWLRQDKAGGGQKICVTHFCSFKAKLSLKPYNALCHLAGLLAEQVPLFR